jgi:hypothetical protein
MRGSILFLDLATKFGWCQGVPGERPEFGAQLCAEEGAGSAAVFFGIWKWTAERCRINAPKTIVIEAPQDPRHMGPKTTRATAMRLIGLPANVESAAFACKVFDVQEARVDDIRLFLLNKRPKKDVAKKQVIAKLRALGYDVTDPDAADALAGWLYACSQLAPEVAPDTTPLFGEKRPAKAGDLWERGF